MPAPLKHIETIRELPKFRRCRGHRGRIVGVFAAYYLAKRGVHVALVEKGRVGAEQSSRNWGWCRQQNRDARELPIATKASICGKVAAEIGQDTGFRRCGLLYLSNDEAELDRWARWRDFARTVGVTTHMLDGAQASERGRATGALERRRLLSQRRHRRSRAAAPVVARGVILSWAAPSTRFAPRAASSSRAAACAASSPKAAPSRPSRGVGGRRMGLLLLPPARHPLSAGVDSLLDPVVAPGAEGYRMRCTPTHFHDAARRRRPCARRSAGAGGRSDAAAAALLAAFLPMFLEALARPRARAASGCAPATRPWRAGDSTRRHRWNASASSTPPRIAGRSETHRPRARTPARAATGHVTARWAGYIDATPDGVPAIGETSVPRFILAAGFSGTALASAPAPAI